jgi:hypothetical protein
VGSDALARARGAALAVAFVVAAGGRAGADPLKLAPESGKASFGDRDEGPPAIHLLVEMRALGVASARRLATWPDRNVGIEQQQPQLTALEVGLRADLRRASLSFVVRVDPAELTRPIAAQDLEAGAAAGALVHDAYVWWKPFRPLQLVGGRTRVPWSKTRQWEDGDDPLGAPPFLVDRVAPDRRWGLTLLGDLGAMSWAAGVYEDVDALEPRAVPESADVSAGGRVAAMGHAEWTPIAPMYGSNPPGRVTGGWGPLPTPRADPWFGHVRLAMGLGVLWRLSEDGVSRLDVSFSTHVKWRSLAFLAELLVAAPGGGEESELGAHGSVMFLPIDQLGLTGRAEWDGGAGADGAATLGGGIVWHVTKDRRNRIGFEGWIRQDAARETRYDALVVLLQASL